MAKFKAVIHDMDGLLIDSMKHWIDIYRKFFAENNFELTEDVIKYLTGKSLPETAAWLREKFNWQGPTENFVYHRRELTDKIYTEYTQPMPGADSLVKLIGKSPIKQAIASGALADWIDIALKRFGWQEYFDKLISVEHVEHKGKPAPDVYLHAAKVLGVKPSDCVVFEDAENGVTSARAAGMKCVAVLDKRWSFGDFSQADLIVDSLEDKRIIDFLGLN